MIERNNFILIVFLRGRVKFPTGGDKADAFQSVTRLRNVQAVDPVKFWSRQYSLDGRRNTVLTCGYYFSEKTEE
jgi:hypothetical protein